MAEMSIGIKKPSKTAYFLLSIICNKLNSAFAFDNRQSSDKDLSEQKECLFEENGICLPKGYNRLMFPRSEKLNFFG